MITPLGQHIKIAKPERTSHNSFISEVESVSKATVLFISPDISVPFLAGDTIYFFTSKALSLRDEYYVHNDFVLLYE